MICRKIIESTGHRCRDTAFNKNEIGTWLCPYHYNKWLEKLFKKKRAYYKGIVRRREEIVHFIWLDCKRAGKDTQYTMETILKFTNFTVEELLDYIINNLETDQLVFLKRYPNWKELIKKK